jgi:hypothetical protein
MKGKEAGKICNTWLINYGAKQSLKFVGPAIVVTINQIVASLMNKAANFEGHATLNDFTYYTWKKTFALKFINLSIIALLANFKADLGFFNFLGLMNGNYNELDPAWFRNVGGSLCYAIFLEILISPQKHFITWLKTVLNRCYDRGI